MNGAVPAPAFFMIEPQLPQPPFGGDAPDFPAFKLFSQVEQPSRYVGGEVGAIRKPWESVTTRVALVFPDVYEIGISNMGLQVLYQILNDRPDVLAERAYAPWMDYEKALRNEGEVLRSLESRAPLGAFDIVGISIPYELTFTNILNVLDLAGIPLAASDRRIDDPVVIGGGAAVYNPEPIAPFFDAFVIGDGEEVVHEVVDRVARWRASGASRERLYADLAGISGVYVPALYAIHYHDDGRIARIDPIEPAPPTVLRRVVADLDAAPYPVRPLVPSANAVFSRVNVEVTRGCTHGCRFCQAGYTYRPVRERSPERVRELVLDSLENTGFDEVTLSSLSTGDYLCLYPLLRDLVDATEQDKVAYALPSLRIGTLTPAVVRQIKRVTKTGFTMAPEAGTERLRRVINKPISEADLLAAVKNVFSEGWNAIKFYFMIGMPTEEYADLDGIVRMAREALATGRQLGGRPRQIKVSTSNYVPKPMTPFQWVGQMKPEELRARQLYLKVQLARVRGAEFSWKNEHVSLLEAVFSRGDRRLAAAVRMAFERGLRMEAWDEVCDVPGWMKVFEDCGIDPSFYAHRDIPVDEILPWDMIDVGTDKAYFTADLARAMRERTIRDCRYGLCGDCGVCTADASGHLVVPRVYVPEGGRAGEFDLPVAEDTENHPLVPEINAISDAVPVTAPPGPRHVYRVKWSKTGTLAFLSHLEVMSLLMRAARRARLPVALSAGFHPRQLFSFGPALSVGVESRAEYLDLILTRPVAPEALGEALSPMLPSGIRVEAVHAVPPGTPALSANALAYAYHVRWEWGMPDDLPARIQAALKRSAIPVGRTDKKGRPKVVDIRPFLYHMAVRDDRLSLVLTSEGNVTARLPEVLEVALDLPPESGGYAHVTRVGLYVMDNGGLYPPCDFDRVERFDPPQQEQEQLCLQKS